MLSFKQYLLEDPNRYLDVDKKARTESSKKRNKNFEPELVAYYNGTRSKASKADKKALEDMNPIDRKVAEALLSKFGKHSVWKFNRNGPIGKHMGSEKYPVKNKTYLKYGSDSKTVSKTDVILDNKKISLKASTGSIVLGSIRGSAGASLFVESLKGPKKIKDANIKSIVSTLEKRMTDSMFKGVEDVAVKNGKKERKKYDKGEAAYNKALAIEISKLEKKHYSPKKAPKNVPQKLIDKWTKQARKLVKVPKPNRTDMVRKVFDTDKVTESYRKFNEDVAKDLNKVFSTSKDFKFNCTYNEATGSARFGKDSIATADYLCIISKDDVNGKIHLLRDFNDDSTVEGLMSKSNIKVMIEPARAGSGVEPMKQLKLVQGILQIVSGYGQKTPVKHMFEMAENYINAEMNKIDPNVLTEGVISDMIKNTMSKVKSYLTKAWNKIVKFIGDSWERLFETFGLEPNMRFDIKL